MNNKDNKNDLPKNAKRINEDDFLLIPLLYSYTLDADSFRPSNIVKYVKIYHPSEYMKTHNLFALKCNSKDLEPTINLDDIMVFHQQSTADIGNYVLFSSPLGLQVGKLTKRDGIPGISFKSNVSEWHPGKGSDLGIYAKLISIMRDF